jgi:hypothetical protein
MEAIVRLVKKQAAEIHLIYVNTVANGQPNPQYQLADIIQHGQDLRRRHKVQQHRQHLLVKLLVANFGLIVVMPMRILLRGYKQDKLPFP